MKKIRIRPEGAKRLASGYPLVQKLDLMDLEDLEITTEWVQFVTGQSHYIATGYLGKQNKGYGWVISTDETRPINQAFFERRFKQAKDRRSQLLNNSLTTAFRLFNGEGDGVGGLTVDQYNEFAVLSWYNETIYAQRELILAALRKVYPQLKGFYSKNRFELKGLADSQHLAGKKAPEPLVIQENGVNYATYLDDGMMTGIFLDQRVVRGKLVDGLAMGKKVLNTFSYTGAFSVAAAMGGARETVSVDLAKRSQVKTEEQFAANGITLDNHLIYVMDVFDYFNYAQRNHLSYEMIILDPPSFARNKKRTFSVAQDYGELVGAALDILETEGLLIASTNAANLSEKEYTTMIETAMKKRGRKFERLEKYSLPLDFSVSRTFPEGDYLKVIIYQVL